MVESGYVPEDEIGPIGDPDVRYAERMAGMTLAQMAEMFQLDTADTTLLLKAIASEQAISAAGGAVHEVRTDDEYVLPSIPELIDGGGNYWRPLFSAQRAMLISTNDDLQGMAERGLAHMLTQREPLTTLIEQLPQGEQVLYKALSARILEMSVRRTMIERALAEGDTAKIQTLMGGTDPETLLKQGEQLGLLHPARAGGAIASDSDDIRSGYSDPAGRTVAAMRMMEGRLGKLLKRSPTPIKPETFLPHLAPAYATAFSRYSAAKFASSAAPVL